MIVYTSITLNYLPKARVLSRCLKKLHPNWDFDVVINDKLDKKLIKNFNNNNSNYFNRISWLENLEIEDKDSWIYKHTVVELCTAIKGIYLNKLIDEGYDKILYIDPDIAIFNDISEVDNLLDEHAILLTPHLLDFTNNTQSILDNEIFGTLRHGIFNLGFLGINANRKDGQRFSDWWSSRLFDYCYADYDKGLFTDQKWCDLIPSFFEDYYIIRDPGYNVASWNINNRKITFSQDGQLMVNDQYPLRFFHFTGYDSGAGSIMTHRYQNNNPILDELWDWYSRQITTMGQNKLGKMKCSYDFYDNGNDIFPADRKNYRILEEQGIAHPNPYKVG